MNTPEIKSTEILKNIPQQVNDTDVFVHMYKEKIDWKYVQALKDCYDFNDNIFARILNISAKTFQSYKKPDHTVDQNVKEPILLLLSLAQHVFGSKNKFEEWLQSRNFYFDDNPPIEFLSTVSGIRFIDDRLTGMEYGDNV